MKKIFTILCIALLMFTMAGCNEQPSQGNHHTPNKNDQKEKPDKINFEEETIIDNQKCRVIIKEINPKGTFGYSIKAELANKSGDQTYMYTIDHASLNGVQMDPYFATVLAPAEKASEEISFSDDKIIKEIGDITDIELSLNVYDSNDHAAEPIAQEVFHLYPYGKEYATVYEKEMKQKDQLLAENKQIKVVMTGYESDPTWGFSINLYLLNKTNKTLIYCMENVMINDIPLDSSYVTLILANKSSFSVMNWLYDLLQQNNIYEIKDIEFTIRVYDQEDEKEYYNKQVVLHP